MFIIILYRPTELTSKKPTSRKREVLDVDKVKSRDPRFLSLSGNFSQDLFEKSFSFLQGSLNQESESIKDDLNSAELSLRRAKALPGRSDDKFSLIQHHQSEVNRLSKELQSIQSQIQTKKKKDIEKNVLKSIKKEEKDKQNEGKKAYYLKSCKFLKGLKA